MTAGRELKHQSTMQELFMVSSSSLLNLSTGQEELSPLSIIHNSITDESCSSSNDGRKPKELDLHEYMARRVMSPLQERMNAITMIPSPLYCWYYILAGLWIHPDMESDPTSEMDDSICIKSSWFPNMTALPPPTMTAVAIGITLHAPFSFLYHYRYAHAMDPTQRVSHWSRRMDHSAIHACSALVSYATSDSWKYFLLNIVYNSYCIYCQFQPRVRPRQNQTRVFISMLAYTIPILYHGDRALFARCWIVLLIGGYIFISYPFRGWSHSVFHLVLCLLPPLLMESSLRLETSQPYLQTAMQCQYHD